jgi:hypothetical protein
MENIACTVLTMDCLQPVTQNEVMTAAYKDCKNAIVVYASEAAMNEPVRQLPDELEVSVYLLYLSFPNLTGIGVRANRQSIV